MLGWTLFYSQCALLRWLLGLSDGLVNGVIVGWLVASSGSNMVCRLDMQAR